MTRTSRTDVTMMYLIHDAIRRDLDRLEDGLHQLASMHAGADRRAMIDALDRTWADFDRYLHEHDTVEDAWLWPALRRASPLTGELLDELAGEHATIEPLTRACRSAMVRALTYYPTFEDATRAADAMGALRGELRAHLEHEEDAALPYVVDHLGPKWWAVFEARQRKEAGPSGLTRFLPWILDDADAVRADWLREQMRTPVYAAGAIFLRRRQRRVAALREM